jgi:sterol desaturase/sphingolipid hydroxylase (fatty acid hydroxylase superfamily)
MNRLRTWFSYSIYPLIVGGGALIVFGIGNNFNLWLIVPPVLIAAAATVMILERVLPYEKEPTPAPLAVDATHYIVNYGIKQAALMLYAQLVGSFGVFGFLWISSWSFAAQAILALVIIDFFLYAIHRLSHENEFLWRFHELHHSSEQLYWVNGEKRHLLHQIIEGLPGITVVMLLGAPSTAVVAALAILTLNMMLQHANIDYRAGVLRYVFSVAELHRWHHLRDAEKSRVNFGAWLIVWDLLFQTYSYPAGRVSWNKNRNEIGVEDSHPQTYFAQFLHPFKNIAARRLKSREVERAQ